jgi:hypothetical protein
MVATDGHTLLATRIDKFDVPSYIVPSETVKAALSLNKKAAMVEVTSLLFAGISYTPIDGKYPDWFQIVPTELSGEVATFDADYLARIKDAAIDMGYSKSGASALAIGFNGESANVISLPEVDALAIVLPIRKYGAEPFNQAAYAVDFLSASPWNDSRAACNVKVQS